MIRVRFAPSPTGPLTVGGARVALANDLFARRGGGQMLLRFDDLDSARSRSAPAAPRAAEQITQDLRWFGIDWHGCIRQSERHELYGEAIARLQRDKHLYPCFESEEELKAKRELRRKRNQPVIYDRAMLALTDKQRHDAEAGGKRPHWRLQLSGRTLEWNDLILGPRRAALSAVSDPIVVRADGTATPVLASVVDDIDHATTHIIRGEDSAGNTAVQLELFELLSGNRPPVRFGHLPGLGDSAGGGRRVGSMTLRGLRNDGVEPLVIAACMAGERAEGSIAASLEELARRTDLADISASRFDVAGMLALNRIALRDMAFAAVADRLPPGATEAFWLAVRGSLDLLKEARGWWDVVAGTIIPPLVEAGRDLLLAAGPLLPPEPWDNGVWRDWIAALERATGHTEEALLVPLRLALTGEDSGPDLAALLPLIGRSRAADRLAMTAV